MYAVQRPINAAPSLQMQRVLDASKHPHTGQQLQHLVEDILHTNAIYLSTLPVRISGGAGFLFARTRTVRACVAFVRRVLKASGKQLKTTKHSVRHGGKVKTIYTYRSI